MDYSNLPKTRAEAIAVGSRRYFTGIPCKHGHTVPRHLTGTCSECSKHAVKRWEARNPELVKARAHRYYLARPTRIRENGLRSKRKAMGIPEADRPTPENCELCTRTLIVGKIHLDHDHATGKFRGWLCSRCNLGLGTLGDTVAGLERALDYLRRTGSS